MLLYFLITWGNNVCFFKCSDRVGWGFLNIRTYMFSEHWLWWNVKPNVPPQCAVFKNFEDLVGEKFTGLFLLLLLPLPQFKVLFISFLFFNRALFLQCSHITSVQSPYVLNSNVVDYRRILTTSLSVKQRLCKNDTPTDTNRSSDGNLLWCTFLHSAFSHRYLMSPLLGGYFLTICNYHQSLPGQLSVELLLSCLCI